MNTTPLSREARLVLAISATPLGAYAKPEVVLPLLAEGLVARAEKGAYGQVWKATPEGKKRLQAEKRGNL